MEKTITIKNAKELTYKEFAKILKEKYNLIYKGSEGIQGLFEYHKFKTKYKNEYFEINDKNLKELALTDKTIIKEW